MGAINEKIDNAINRIEDSVGILNGYKTELTAINKAAISIFAVRLLKLVEAEHGR